MRDGAAVIFDMDGVLVDGEPLHYEVVRRLLAEEHVTFGEADYQRYLGTTLESTWNDLRERYGLSRSYGWYADAYHREVVRSYREDAELLPGAEALLERLGEAAVPLALASSSNREWVDAALDSLGLRRFFEQTVAGDEVARGKPDPEIYLRAAERLGAAPERCLAVEDAPSGIASARAAGMSVVAVRTPMTANLPLADATWIIDSLSEFDIAWLAGLGPAQTDATQAGALRASAN